MLQCSECEYFRRSADGSAQLTCDPFATIKEPECLHKWQLLRIDAMVRAYEATLAMYRRMAPLQEKMMRHMEQEIAETESGDAWKQNPRDVDDFDDDDDDSDDDDGGR